MRAPDHRTVSLAPTLPPQSTFAGRWVSIDGVAQPPEFNTSNCATRIAVSGSPKGTVTRLLSHVMPGTPGLTLPAASEFTTHSTETVAVTPLSQLSETV